MHPVLEGAPAVARSCRSRCSAHGRPPPGPQYAPCGSSRTARHGERAPRPARDRGRPRPCVGRPPGRAVGLSPGRLGLMTATLVAKDLAAGHGDRALFSGLDLVVAPGDVDRPGRRQRRGQVDAAADPRRAATGPSRASSRLSPPTATVGYLPQEPERRRGRDRPRLPGPAHRRRRRPARHGRGDRRRWSTERPAPTTRTPTAWSAGSPSAAPTSTSAPARSPPTSAWPSTSTSR